MGEVTDSGWDPAAVRRLRVGEFGVLDGRPLAAVLQHLGQVVLAAGVAGNEDLARRCAAGLRERDAPGDEVLATELLAELGDPITTAYVRWPLTATPVDLELLAGVLDGDPRNGDGAVDVVSGDIYPPGSLDRDRPAALNEDSETFDPDRWLLPARQPRRIPRHARLRRRPTGWVAQGATVRGTRGSWCVSTVP